MDMGRSSKLFISFSGCSFYLPGLYHQIQYLQDKITQNAYFFYVELDLIFSLSYFLLPIGCLFSIVCIVVAKEVGAAIDVFT